MFYQTVRAGLKKINWIVLAVKAFRLFWKRSADYVSYICLFVKIVYTKKGKKSVAFFEPNPYHAETFVGYAKYFIDAGYLVHVILDKEIEKENPFCRFVSPMFQVFYIKLTVPLVERISGGCLLNNYSHILITSSVCYRSGSEINIQELLSVKNGKKTFFVEHDLDNIDKFHENDIAKENRLWTLLGRTSYSNMQTVMVNPNFYGSVSFPCYNKDIVNFIAIGVGKKEYRNYGLLENAANKLVESGISKINISIVGYRYNQNEMNNSVINYCGRLRFDEMYKEIEKSCYLLFLLDPNVEGNKRYLRRVVTGSFQLALGFRIIPILDRTYAEAYGLNDNNAIIYEHNDLFSGMRTAMQLKEEEYVSRQRELGNYARAISNVSMENVKKAIGYDC